MSIETKWRNKKDDRKHAILVGAGELDKSMAIKIKNSISEHDYVIALDGGLNFCAEHGIEPDMIVGDFDSLTQEINKTNKEQHAQSQQKNMEMPTITKDEILTRYPKEIIYRLPCEKDDTDTLAAIKMAIEKGFIQFTIYGGLGGRLSHTMANIQTLMYLKEQGLYGELIGDKCRVLLIKNESISLQPYGIKEESSSLKLSMEKADKLSQPQTGGYISIFSYSEKAVGVTLKNLKYEIEDAELTNTFPIGVSNEFVGKKAEISVKQGVLLIVAESREE